MQPPGNAPHSLPVDYQVLIVEDEFFIANDLSLILQKAGYSIMGIADSVIEAQSLIDRQKPDMVLLDIYLKGKETGIDLARQLEIESIPFIYISANDNRTVLEEVKATQPSGYIVKPFREKDILTVLEISRYRHGHRIEVKLREEKMLQIALVDGLSEQTSWGQRLRKAAILLQAPIPFDYLCIGFEKAPDRSYSYYRVGYDEYQTISPVDFLNRTGFSREQAYQMQTKTVSETPNLYNGTDFKTLCQQDQYVQLIAKSFRLESVLVFPLNVARMGSVRLFFFSRHANTYLPQHKALLERLGQPMGMALDRVLAFEEIARLSEQLQQEKKYLLEEVKTSANFEEIIGTSQHLQAVFNQVSQVAPTDSTVLLMGESGTGKELFARAIHHASHRKERILVKINCATLPANLIESELFGHEKGAFTGAFEKRIGKFELAHGGTLFLDEIGEMPLELQAKLLRVLQEKEFERLGGKNPIQTDVRVIAATNRQLEKEVAEGRFRLDLYFRLSVFPITLPSLRERKSDIPQLAHFFAQRSARKMGKDFKGISGKALEEMLGYAWPGNIRELENVIEQAVIINNGHQPLELGRPLINRFNLPDLSPALLQLNTGSTVDRPAEASLHKEQIDVRQLLQETERDHILSVLAQVNGRIRGSGGAAELLNLKPTTLEYRMEKLGIRKVPSVHLPIQKSGGSK